MIYRIGKFNVTSVKQIEGLLSGVQSGVNVKFTVGVITASGQDQRVVTLSMVAR